MSDREDSMIEQAPFNCGRCPTPCTCLEVGSCLSKKADPETDDE